MGVSHVQGYVRVSAMFKVMEGGVGASAMFKQMGRVRSVIHVQGDGG